MSILSQLYKAIAIAPVEIYLKSWPPLNILNILNILKQASFAGKSLVTASMKGLKHSLVSQENGDKSPNYNQLQCLWQMQPLSYFQFNQNIPAFRERTDLNSTIDQW